MHTEIVYSGLQTNYNSNQQSGEYELKDKDKSEKVVQYESAASETDSTSNAADLDTDNIYQHYESSVRLLRIRKSITGSCGFHLTRTKWDPYPWVSAVDAHTAAEMSGLKAGDCVLEVNGEDVLGLRITDIAKLVQAKSGHVTLLLWSCGSDFQCDPENICCAPMPRTLQRLATIVQSILSIIECPVCLDTITPPTMQCQNGHLLCLNCRIRAEKCPVCRDRYTPQRALIAEQIYAAITSAYNLCSGNEDKLRQKLFGQSERAGVAAGMKVMTRRWRRVEAAKQTIDEQAEQTEVRKDRKGGCTMKWRRPTAQVDGVGETQSQHVVPGAGQAGRFSFVDEADIAERMVENAVAKTDAMAMKRDGRRKKILMKLWHTKAASMENLSTATSTTASSSEHTSNKMRGVSDYINGLASDSATTPTTGNQHPNVHATQLFPNRSKDEMEWAMKNSQNHSNSRANNSDGPYKVSAEATMATIKEAPQQTGMRQEAEMETHTYTGTETDLTMPLNCEITRKTILNVTTTIANDVMSQLSSASSRTPMASDAKSVIFQQPTSTAEDNKVRAVEEDERNGKYSLKQKHVEPHCQCDNATSETAPGTPSPPAQTIAVRRCPSAQQRSQQLNRSIFNDNKNNISKYEHCSCPSSSSLIFIDKRRPVSNRMSLSSGSIEYLKASYCCCTSPTDQLLPADSKIYTKDTNNNVASDTDAASTRNSSILTPASSLSSGVFSTNSSTPNDLQVSELAPTTTAKHEAYSDLQQKQKQRQQSSTEITAITMHKDALLSSMSRLGRPASSITSSLCSLSSLTSSLFSSASDMESPLPLIAAASVGACSSTTAPVAYVNSEFCISDQSPSSSSSPSSAAVNSPLLCTELNKDVKRYRCPCDDCRESFNASSQLQQHVKAVHRLPILSFGGNEHAKITVPLRPPLDDAVLILETSKSENAKNIIDSNNNNNNNSNKKENNAFSDVCRKVDDYKDNADCVGQPNDIDTQASHKSGGTERKIIEDVHSKYAEKQLEQTRECWIRIKVDGGSIQTAAVLQATAAESAYYVLKVRLSGIGDTTPLAKDTDGQMAIELQLVRW
ncbi:unnamed protein product [Ceratitis capitata]|uniref:(Mediterranean fruit fly) hypothetical protein n=1 Tax=Ceratitis capitata TaxID=7213 RepID=A0A811U6G7_CERCA|nr:unnamed protein product [Ceratitis capitata]